MINITKTEWNVSQYDIFGSKSTNVRTFFDLRKIQIFVYVRQSERNWKPWNVGIFGISLFRFGRCDENELIVK